MKSLPDPRVIAARTNAALRELAAAESLACNLAAGLRADALLVDERWASAGLSRRPSRDRAVSSGEQVHESSQTGALAKAVEATDRAIGLGQAIESWSALARRWTALLSPALLDPAALATVGVLATLDLVEDFISQSNRLFALAAEASESCRESAAGARRFRDDQ